MTIPPHPVTMLVVKYFGDGSALGSSRHTEAPSRKAAASPGSQDVPIYGGWPSQLFRGVTPHV